MDLETEHEQQTAHDQNHQPGELLVVENPQHDVDPGQVGQEVPLEVGEVGTAQVGQVVPPEVGEVGPAQEGHGVPLEVGEVKQVDPAQMEEGPDSSAWQCLGKCLHLECSSTEHH